MEAFQNVDGLCAHSEVHEDEPQEGPVDTRVSLCDIKEDGTRPPPVVHGLVPEHPPRLVVKLENRLRRISCGPAPAEAVLVFVQALCLFRPVVQASSHDASNDPTSGSSRHTPL